MKATGDTVLVVDDSLTIRMDLSEAFEVGGFHVVLCATVAEARDALSRLPVGLIVLDVLLPDADGVDFLREVRGTPEIADVAVVMLSTEAEVKDRVRGLQTGADDYVGKPYDTGYLVSRARELLRARRLGETPDRAMVLLIDDSATSREELGRSLQAAGYAVLTADSGEAGLRLAADNRPSAVIVDGSLPGIDGSTVIRRIRLDAALRRTPCLLLTASDERAFELHALEAGADAFVRKEEDADVILARLASVLRSSGDGVRSRQTASLAGPKKILAVDDSATHLHEIGDALRHEGYDVVLAHSGEEALELVAVQPVDCILLDLMMPGIGGEETCRRVKSASVTRDIPIIMLTALEDRSAVIRGLTAGADDFIAKSSDFEVLHARLLAQIRRKQFEDENRLIREQLLRKELETAEARAAREMAEARAAMVEELERKNKELDAFSYSVAHDLRAPLRGIDGFSKALVEDFADRLDADGRRYLQHISESAGRMSLLIDGLLSLAQVTRSELRRERVDLSALARATAERLHEAQPDRQVVVAIADGLVVDGDARLLAAVIDNLLGNAWKFSSKCAAPKIEFGVRTEEGKPVYFVRDNGAGFDMAYAAKLFGAFQRLHKTSDFEGTGIGLATVERIIRRHGGRIWAEGAVDEGAMFSFVLDDGGG